MYSPGLSNAGACRCRRRWRWGSLAFVIACDVAATAGVRGCSLAPAFLVLDGWLRGCSLAPVTGIKGGGSLPRWVLTRGFVVLDGWLHGRSLAPVTWQVVGCPFGGQRATWDEVGAYSPRLCPDASGCRYRQVALVGFDRWRSWALVNAGAGDKGGGLLTCWSWFDPSHGRLSVSTAGGGCLRVSTAGLSLSTVGSCWGS
jgi:hypothetical protein